MPSHFAQAFDKQIKYTPGTRLSNEMTIILDQDKHNGRITLSTLKRTGTNVNDRKPSIKKADSDDESASDDSF